MAKKLSTRGSNRYGDMKMDPKQLYELIRKIADLAFEYASPATGSDLWLADRRDESVNPYYNQTESGLFLEVYYGIPGKIWTPWGTWNCWGSGSGDWDAKMDEFLARLGAVVYQPLQKTSMGEFGPVYALTKVDGIQLPPAKKRDRTDYLAYDDAKLAWENLTR